MGPGSEADDGFKEILEVLDWIRQGIVLVHKDTRAKGQSSTTQGEHFTDTARVGDYFYLCHGNELPSIILLGQFTGPANLFCERGDGWADRPFRWIKTSINSKSFVGEQKWWTPNHNSTFVSVPPDELDLFEEVILRPYFGMWLAQFRL
jgi:hypothetical protein